MNQTAPRSTTQYARYVSNTAPATSAASNARAIDCPRAGWMSDAAGGHARGSTLHAIVERTITGAAIDPADSELLDASDWAAVDWTASAVRAVLDSYRVRSETIAAERRFTTYDGNGNASGYVKPDLYGEGCGKNGEPVIIAIDLKFGVSAHVWADDGKSRMTANAIWNYARNYNPRPAGLVMIVMNGDTRAMHTAPHTAAGMEDRRNEWNRTLKLMTAGHDCPREVGAHCVGCTLARDCPALAEIGDYYMHVTGASTYDRVCDAVMNAVNEMLGADELYRRVTVAHDAAERERREAEEAKQPKPATVPYYQNRTPASAYDPDELAYITPSARDAIIAAQEQEERDLQELADEMAQADDEDEWIDSTYAGTEARDQNARTTEKAPAEPARNGERNVLADE